MAGIEARGFILAAPVACELGAGFVPVRKQGKLPSATFRRTTSSSTAPRRSRCIGTRSTPGDRVLIVDDVLATGGTARPRRT